MEGPLYRALKTLTPLTALAKFTEWQPIEIDSTADGRDINGYLIGTEALADLAGQEPSAIPQGTGKMNIPDNLKSLMTYWAKMHRGMTQVVTWPIDGFADTNNVLDAAGITAARFPYGFVTVTAGQECDTDYRRQLRWSCDTKTITIQIVDWTIIVEALRVRAIQTLLFGNYVRSAARLENIAISTRCTAPSKSQKPASSKKKKSKGSK